MKRTIVRTEDGQRMAVIRPRTTELAELAVSLAKVAEQHQDEALFQRIPAEVGEYTFVGYLGEDPRKRRRSVVDGDGKHLGELQRGDSFVGESELEAMATPPS